MKQHKIGIIVYGIVGKQKREYIDLNPYFQTHYVSDVNFDAEGNFSDGVYYFKDYREIFDHELELFLSLGYSSHPLYSQELELGYRVLREPLGMTRAQVHSPVEERCPQLLYLRGDSVNGCVLFLHERPAEGHLLQMAVDESRIESCDCQYSAITICASRSDSRPDSCLLDI